MVWAVLIYQCLSAFQGMLKLLSPFSRALKHRSSVYRRFHANCYAWLDRLRDKPCYSQFNEDYFILEYLRERGGIREGWIYIDVGANHPTLINDTYLFYKLGNHGIILEPNMEFAQLFRSIRPRDFFITAAAGKKPGLARFYQTNNPFFSTLNEKNAEDRVSLTNIVPVITLDQLIDLIEFDGIFLLKIDTEGYDCTVLIGAKFLLSKTLLVMTETPNDVERKNHKNILGDDWIIIYAKHNTIFLNQVLANIYLNYI